MLESLNIHIKINYITVKYKNYTKNLSNSVLANVPITIENMKRFKVPVVILIQILVHFFMYLSIETSSQNLVIFLSYNDFVYEWHSEIDDILISLHWKLIIASKWKSQVTFVCLFSLLIVWRSSFESLTIKKYKK